MAIDKNDNIADDIKEDVIESPDYSGKVKEQHKGFNTKNIIIVLALLIVAAILVVKFTSIANHEKTPEEIAKEQTKNLQTANINDADSLGINKLQESYNKDGKEQENNKFAEEFKKREGAITTNQEILNRKNSQNNQYGSTVQPNQQFDPYQQNVRDSNNSNISMPAAPQYQKNGSYQVPSPNMQSNMQGPDYSMYQKTQELEKKARQNEVKELHRQQIEADNKRKLDEMLDRVRKGALSFTSLVTGNSNQDNNKTKTAKNIELDEKKAQLLNQLKGMNNGIQMPNLKMPTLGNTDMNKQSDKQEYFDKARHDEQKSLNALKQAISPYQIMAGTIIPSTFITGIKGDLPGQIIGQVRENVYDSVRGRYLLIPQGTRLVGEYSNTVTPGQDRLLIVWTRLLLPNGDSISLDGMPGVDLSGYAGVEDKVNYHFLRIATGAVLSSLMGAGVSVAGGNNEAGKATFGQLAAGGAAQKIQSAGDSILDQMLKVQPTIYIRAGQKFNVFVNKDLILRPYR